MLARRHGTTANRAYTIRYRTVRFAPSHAVPCASLQAIEAALQAANPARNAIATSVEGGIPRRAGG